MGRLVYIPPQKGAVRARPQTPAPAIPADLVMNCLQFVNTLKGTSHEVFSTLIKRELGSFHGTVSEWNVKLDELKAVPA